MSARRRVITAGLIGLAVVDVFLVGLALGVGSSPDPGSAGGARVAQSPTGAPAPLPPPDGPAASGVPSTVGGPEPPGEGSDERRPLPIDAIPGLTLRADPGDCVTGGAQLWISTDGSSWQQLSVPADEVRRVAVESPADLWIVGGRSVGSGQPAQGDCEPGFWRSRDGGSTWAQAASTDGAWYVPADGGGLHAPDQVILDVCGAAEPMLVVPAGSDSAAVSCADGSVRWTDDGGQLWRSGAPRPGVQALGLWTAGDGLAVSRTGDCAGLRTHITSDGGVSWQERSCLEVDSGPDGAVAAGPVGVAAYGDEQAVLVVGTGAAPQAWVTGDAGRSWAPVDEG